MRNVLAVTRFLLRPVFITLLLLPLCCFWAQNQGVDRIFSLMVPSVALTMCVALLSLAVRRFMPRLALSGAELMVIYSMLATACAMSAEWMDVTAPQLYGYGAFQDQNPNYKETILPYVSDSLFLKNIDELKDLKSGGKSWLFFTTVVNLYLPKIGLWTLFFTLLTTAMLCINALLRDQWVHHEKLAFPLLQIPLALADMGDSGNNSSPPLFRSKLLWIAFAFTFGIDMLNGLSFLYPSLPSVNIRFLGNITQVFTSPPWNQTGWVPVGLFPYLAALGIFMPTDLLFSLLFFFFVRKAQQLVAYSMGFPQGTFGGGGLVPSPPFFSEQSWGAFLGLFLSALWLSRRHLRAVWDSILTGAPTGGENGLSYRLVFGLFVTSIVGIGLFGFIVIGIPLWWTLMYVALFLAFSVAVTRLRAQLGAPTHEMAFMGPHQLILGIGGTGAMPPELAARTMTAFHVMNRIHRTHPMPTLLDGQYLADRLKISQGAMFAALIIAVVLGTLGGFAAHIAIAYKYLPTTWISGEVSGVVRTLQTTPRPPNPGAMAAVGVGAFVVWVLDFVRFRFPGFPLHPAGYALAMNFGVDYYWFGLLLALIAKSFTLRYYGLRGYDKLRQVAIGLILGEFVAETIWASYSMLTDRATTYSISINGKMGWDQ